MGLASKMSGTINVVQPQLAQQLLDGVGADARDVVHTARTPRTSRKGSSRRMAASWSGNAMQLSGDTQSDTAQPVLNRAEAQRKAREEELARKDEQFRLETQRKYEDMLRRREEEFQEMYKEVLGGLSYQEGVTGELQDVVDVTTKQKLRKKKQLHHEWQHSVFDKLQGRLQNELAKRSATDITARLSQQYNDYLHTTNTKAAVFRDVIIEADYNPLRALESSIRIPSSDIVDPLKRDFMKGVLEQRQMGRTAPATRNKPMFALTMWDKVESTPYGRNMTTNGDYIIKHETDGAVKRRLTHVVLDHYNVPMSNEAALAECPKGKAMISKACNGEGMFSTLQYTDANKTRDELQAEGKLQGDLWLSAKGKRFVAGPEQRRGRRDLSDVMQQKPGSISDLLRQDAGWDKVGKKPVEGPEQRRGRRGLWEIVQQSSKPYIDGRTLGDAFLETKGKAPASFAPPDNHLDNLLRDDCIAPLPQHVPHVDSHSASHLVTLDGSLTTNVIQLHSR